MPSHLDCRAAKDSLLGVIEGVCREHRVAYTATRGNTSQTEAYRAGKRLAEYVEEGLVPIVLHLADHDPTGVDMTRDCENRISATPDSRSRSGGSR